MNKFLPATFLSTIVLLFLSVALFAQNNEDVFYPGQLWIQVDPGETKSIIHEKKKVDVNSFIDLIGKELAKEFNLQKVAKPFYFARTNDISEVYQIFFRAAGEELQFARKLEALSSVQYAERIPVMRPTLEPNDLGPQNGNGNQWSLWMIDAPQAWDISTGNTEIKVAIVDDAVLTTHPDLIPNLVSGYDVADDDNDPMPNEPAMSHGTHVAGIVGAASNNGTGVASIGYGLKIIPVKSSNVPETISDAYAGVIWAADNDADVINMSWGGSGFSNTGQNIINYAYDAGCVNVAATGNDDVSEIFYPAGYDNVLSVSSTTANDTKSDFSNYGSWVDVSSPGSQILSTYIGGGFQPVYANNSGTSMASPLVAGLAGLVLSVNPELPQQQVIDCILNTAEDISVTNPNYLGQLGSGRVNAHQAVLCAQATLSAPPVAVVNASNTIICPGGLVQFYGSSAGGLASTYEWSFPGGIPATSSDQNPVVAYPVEGNFDVTLNVINEFGDNEIELNDFVEISTNGTDVLFSENFEAGTFAENGWSIDNPDGDITWEISTVAGSAIGNKAASINLFNYNVAGERDGLISPTLDLSNHYNVQLDFEHAHRRYSADYSDSLIVYVSTDGGATFPHRVLEVAENGGGTFATGTLLNENFVPNNGSDWCFGGDVGSPCFSINLSEFDGETDLRIKFETYNDYGNNIYLDNIALTGNCLLVLAAPVADLNALPTNICVGESVQFYDQSNNVPSSYEWIFEGGNPATSNLPSQEVTYDTPGTYDVTLVVSNAFGTDNVVLEDYILVSEAPLLNVEASEIIVCAGQPAVLSASGADSYSWSPDIALSATTGSEVEASPAAPIEYTVTGYSNGCAVEETILVDVLPAPVNPTVVAQNETTFAVLSPPSVSGYFPYTSTSTTNGWGNPDISTLSIEGEMVIARDATAADSLLCNMAMNAGSVGGKIAVVYRGGCEFGVKALNAQDAGATAVVIVNNESGAPIELGPGAQGAMVSIPVIMVSDVTGGWINDEINAGNASAVIGQFNGGGMTICPGETLRLAAPGGWDQYIWTNDENDGVIEIGEPGDYDVEVFGDNGCSSASESFTVDLYDVVQPIIEPNSSGGLIVNNVSADDFDWYYNGELIEGANDNTIEIVGNGIYTVEIVDNNGCESNSDPYEITTVRIADMNAAGISVYPVPATDRVTIETESDFIIESLRIFTPDGREITNSANAVERGTQIVLDIDSWATGTYLLRITGDDQIFHSQILKVN